MIASVRADPAAMQECYEADGRSIAAGLHAVADVLARTPIAEATMFRQMLLGTFGLRLAEGRGRFGRSATAEDMRELRIAVQLLADTSSASERAGVA